MVQKELAGDILSGLPKPAGVSHWLLQDWAAVRSLYSSEVVNGSGGTGARQLSVSADGWSNQFSFVHVSLQCPTSVPRRQNVAAMSRCLLPVVSIGRGSPGSMRRAPVGTSLRSSSGCGDELCTVISNSSCSFYKERGMRSASSSYDLFKLCLLGPAGIWSADRSSDGKRRSALPAHSTFSVASPELLSHAMGSYLPCCHKDWTPWGDGLHNPSPSLQGARQGSVPLRRRVTVPTSALRQRPRAMVSVALQPGAPRHQPFSRAGTEAGTAATRSWSGAGTRGGLPAARGSCLPSCTDAHAAARRQHWQPRFLLSSAGSCPETQPGEPPAAAAAAAQADGTDLASPMSPRTSKSRMSMKLRRSSGSANKSWGRSAPSFLTAPAACSWRTAPGPCLPFRVLVLNSDTGILLSYFSFFF